MSELPDPTAFRAQLDQGGAMLRDLAAPIAGFWNALKEAGMDPAAATAVVCQYVAVLMSQVRPPQ